MRREILKLAVDHTATKRGSVEEIKEYKEICDELRKEDALKKLWDNYIEENAYAAHLKFEDMVDNVIAVGKFIDNLE